MEDKIEILKATIENDVNYRHPKGMAVFHSKSINNLREVKDNFERIGICMTIIQRIEKLIELEITLKK